MLNGYRRVWDYAYIGITANPVARWRRHEGRGWAKMVLVYCAYTPDIARTVETELIDYARRCNFLFDIQNVNPGGEGILDRNGAHFVYVLVKNGTRASSRRSGRGNASAWP